LSVDDASAVSFVAISAKIGTSSHKDASPKAAVRRVL
jgi:hypothetical protein